MICTEARERIAPLEAEFAVRFYRWAEEDLRREIAADFTRIKKMKSSLAFHYLELLDGLPKRERSETAFAILRASITHKLARETLGLILTSAEKEHMRRWQSRLFPIFTWSEMERKIRRHEDKLSLDKDKFEELLTTEIAKRLKSDPALANVCLFRQKVGNWYLETGCDVRSIYQFRYGHYITARICQDPFDFCPVHLKQGGVTIGGWLGFNPGTTLNLLRRSEIRATVELIGDAVEQFASEVPKLLEGLTHDIPQELEDPKRKSPARRGKGKPPPSGKGDPKIP